MSSFLFCRHHPAVLRLRSPRLKGMFRLTSTPSMFLPSLFSSCVLRQPIEHSLRFLMATSTKSAAAVLQQQDDECSTYIISVLRDNEAMARLSRSEGEAIVTRDEEDEGKLAAGVQIGIRKGILKASEKLPPSRSINVVGRSAQEVTDQIVALLPSQEGNVIILQGLSGTGKGTTVAKLQRVLPKCVTWSNGNVFRSYAFLCQEVLSAQGKEVSTETLTDDVLAAVEKRVTFVQVGDGTFDTMIDGDVRVTDIQNTSLRTPYISAIVPTVAEQTQGEVVRFGAGAVEKLRSAGYNVILEGRAQTLQFIPTNERFELVIPDVSLLGQRRAAQRVMAKALELLGSQLSSSSDDAVKAAVIAAVNAIA